MARPHIEFIQSQRLAWVPLRSSVGRPGAFTKILSVDEDDGAATQLIQYPAGWRTEKPAYLEADEELLIVTGSLTINEMHYDAHNFAYLPAGFVIHNMSTQDGAIVLSMFSREPVAHSLVNKAPAFDQDYLIARVDPLTMDWDNSGQDPNLRDIMINRKIMRLDPGGKCRSFLLAGAPHGINPSRKKQYEFHTYSEELFLISGDLAMHCGVMRAGAYFWRPPYKNHGLECSRTGFLTFIRIPGSNDNLCNWVGEGRVSFTPKYDPILPPELERYRDAEMPEIPVY